MKKASSSTIFILLIIISVIFLGLFFVKLGSIYTGGYDIITNIDKINYVEEEPVPIRAQFLWDGASWDDAWITARGFYVIDEKISSVDFPLGRIPDNFCLNNDRKGRTFTLSDQIYTFTSLAVGEHKVDFYLVAGEVNDCESGSSSRKIWEACTSKIATVGDGVVTPDKLIACDSRIKIRATDHVKFNVMKKSSVPAPSPTPTPSPNPNPSVCNWWCSFIEWVNSLFR